MNEKLYLLTVREDTRSRTEQRFRDGHQAAWAYRDACNLVVAGKALSIELLDRGGNRMAFAEAGRPIPKVGDRVRIVGDPTWSSWKRPSIGDTGTIQEPPRALTDGTAVRCGLLWFEIDRELRDRVHTDMFVRPYEVEVLAAASAAKAA